MNYIISLKHTNKGDQFITLWRPNDAGYCWFKEDAGKYAKPKKDYHDSDDSIPITFEDAEKLFILITYDGELKHCIPNCSAVWKQLCVKMVKGNLIKLK